MAFYYEESLIDVVNKSLFTQYTHHKYSLIPIFSQRKNEFLQIKLLLLNEHFLTDQRSLLKFKHERSAHQKKADQRSFF